MNQDSKKTRCEGLIRAVVSKAQLPCDLLGGEFRLELRGRRELYICGCRRILKYSEEQMIFHTRAFDVCIDGKNMSCASFHCSGILVEGLINNIRLENFQ